MLVGLLISEALVDVFCFTVFSQPGSTETGAWAVYT